MSYSTCYDGLIGALFVESKAADSEALRRAVSRLPGVPVRVVDDPSGIPEEHRNGTSIYVHTPRGAPVTRCPGTKGHICCNYLTIDVYSGCPVGCTYCIMRSYLNFSPISVVSDVREIVEDLRRIARANPDIMVRVGSGETGDSLLYDPLFEHSAQIITGVADLPNLSFELKSKTDLVDHLLSVHPKGNAVIGFSLSPQAIIDEEEGRAASLEARLSAARRVVEAGYFTSFHFDPLFHRSDWASLYLPIADRLAEFATCTRVDVSGTTRPSVAWVSLGSFRFPPELKSHIGRRPYLYDELVRSGDGKFRYIQRVRREMYKRMRDRIGRALRVPVYLCMESEAVWRRTSGATPKELPLESPLFEWPTL